MPVRKAWDHVIELKEGFTPRKEKVYSLLREEREEVQAFMEDQLRKGYIWPSKSPQTSPVHFVAKKDGKRRIVQDYHHINQWTIKNRYPLPLIADILDGVGKRKVFTKLDLRWGYNNVRIKEGDEWKAAFTTHIGAYEPTVMDFRLTNSPAVRLANSKAGIKPTAPLSAFDKENSIEFSLDFLHYLYNYYMVCALFSHAYHVTNHVTSCDMMLVTSCHVTMTM